MFTRQAISAINRTATTFCRIVMRPLLCLCAFVPLLLIVGCGGKGGGGSAPSSVVSPQKGGTVWKTSLPVTISQNPEDIQTLKFDVTTTSPDKNTIAIESVNMSDMMTSHKFQCHTCVNSDCPKRTVLCMTMNKPDALPSNSSGVLLNLGIQINQTTEGQGEIKIENFQTSSTDNIKNKNSTSRSAGFRVINTNGALSGEMASTSLDVNWGETAPQAETIISNNP